MFGRIASVLIVGLIILLVSCDFCEAKYPEGLQNASSCEEFGKTGRFNPYSVLHKEWFVFYYWGPAMPAALFLFHYPEPEEKAFLHYVLDEHVTVPINWTSRFVVMQNLASNESSFMVEVGDRGQYLKYGIFKPLKKKPIKRAPIKVLFKQFEGGRYIAYMECVREIVYLMCKRDDVPPKKKLQDVAAKAGFRSRGGKSYLYQGHEWMPVPEWDEESFWNMQKVAEREKKTLEIMKQKADKKLKEKKRKEKEGDKRDKDVKH